METFQGYGKRFGKNYGKKGKYYSGHDDASYHVRPPLDANHVKRDQQQQETASSSQAATKTSFYRMDANDGDLTNIQKSSKSQPARQESEETPASQTPEKVLSLAMVLKSSQEAAIYHTVNGEKRRGLLIDLGAASGLIGPEPLRDIMEHCIPNNKTNDYIIWSLKTTSVAGTSGGSDETLGKVHIKLNPANLHIVDKGNVLGGAGSLCPALVGNPTSSITSTKS